MNRNLFFYFLTLFFLGSSCTSSHEKTFEDLNAQERKMLQKELMDSLRGEMVEYMIEQRKLYLVGLSPCGPYYDFNIKIDEKGVILIQDKVAKTSVRKAIIRYFSVNRNVPQSQWDWDAPYFYEWKKNQLVQNRKDIEKRIELFQKEGMPADYIEFKKQEKIQYETKLEILKVTKSKILPEVHALAHVRVSYDSLKINQATIVDSALSAFYDLRNMVSMEYFNESYLKIYFKSMKFPTKENTLKLNALKFFYPVRIIDIPYAKKHNIYSATPSEVPIPKPVQN